MTRYRSTDPPDLQRQRHGLDTGQHGPPPEPCTVVPVQLLTTSPSPSPSPSLLELVNTLLCCLALCWK